MDGDLPIPSRLFAARQGHVFCGSRRSRCFQCYSSVCIDIWLLLYHPYLYCSSLCDILPPQLALLSLKYAAKLGSDPEVRVRAWTAILTHASLRRLDLTSMGISPKPLSDIPLPLHSLHLKDVNLSERFLIDIIHSCKSLHNLALDHLSVQSSYQPHGDIELSPPMSLKNLWLREQVMCDRSRAASWKRSSWLVGGPQLERLCICYFSDREMEIGPAWKSLQLPKLRRFDFVAATHGWLDDGLTDVR